MARRKCKNCGRTFDSKGPGDCFCSPICRTTGFFVAGGGDTSKPGVAKKPAIVQQPKYVLAKKGDEKFDRVRKMFQVPATERWQIAKDFTEEERAFAKRLERRRLMEEDRIVRELDWSGEDDEESVIPYGALGESDDGSV